MGLIKWHYCLFSLLLLLLSCQSDDPDPQEGGLQLQIEHLVDGDSLSFASTFYPNAAGNEFRVLRLKYFISGIKLYRQAELIYEQNSPPAVINALYPEECELFLSGIASGSYDSLSFSLGVTPAYNYEDALSLAPNNMDMYWPTAMGGGYHFMKFEGHWRDADQYGSYAFHLGQNENLITVGLPLQLSIEAQQTASLNLQMNLAQWFEGPHLYDLRVQGGYTMGDSLQMRLLVENGHNVFSLKP